MAVFRVVKDRDNPYIMVNKYYIYDNRLSLKAKGLMSYFLSRPDDWEFYQNEISQHCTDKKDSLSSAINELAKAGYVERIFKRGEKGKLRGGYDYIVHEIPQIVANEENTCTKEVTECGFSETGENTEIGKNRNRKNPVSEKPPLLNNDNKLNNDNSSCSSNKGLPNKDIYELFQENGFGMLNKMTMELIDADIELYGKEWFVEAMKVAVKDGKYKLNFIEGVLRNWKTDGKKVEKQEKGGIKDGGTRPNTSASPYDFTRFGG